MLVGTYRRVLRVDGEYGVQLAGPHELAERADGVHRVGGGQEERTRRAPLEGGLRGRRGECRVPPEKRATLDWAVSNMGQQR